MSWLALLGPNGIFVILGVIVSLVGGAWLKGRSSGKKAEQAKQAKRDAAAKDERLEMHREATEFERQAAGMSNEELDRRLTK